ncbi:alpha-fucosidase [Paenibacillus sp. KS1]|uniref:alpha-L-fucosidase n=1 Tax=Paenibacillus sp. KS1 TaxID=1849249 RepID=UPI0008066BA1|nr:alpha-L-fucosidase [Paenibacillus sp. KS1]OBY78212.1 alpha-fucosidase [Paenibacillus sp. KS1]
MVMNSSGVIKTEQVKAAALVRPSERQLAIQEMEFYAFVHFTVNTFTDQEWGSGQEQPDIFNPTQLDARQWVRACKAAGMKGLILTCKHHDGFCLWPSEYTEHSVKNSPWKDGKGDVVLEVADACREGGLKFGIYLSPWDRHEPCYGDSPAYNEYFTNQLRELLTRYGDIFCVWFDGACGEGPNGKRQIYDWNGYYALIRELQPEASISVCGPDVRWCGNEAGHCRKSEWSVVPAQLQDKERIQEHSQQEDNAEFAKRFTSEDEDLGSRDIIAYVSELVWYPAEVDTSIRPGWFYHASQDDQVKSLDELRNVYYGSVGGNATLLLNIPADTRGLLHENDVQRLEELGAWISNTFETNVARDAAATASEAMAGYEAANILDGNRDTFWAPEQGTEVASITVDLGTEQTFDHIVLQEYRYTQRIESFSLEYWQADAAATTEDCTDTAAGRGTWQPILEGTIIGHKRICHFPAISSSRLRLQITGSRWWPNLSTFEVYNSQDQGGEGE